ncbi:MAG: hypothetical protein WDA42_00870 [Candidatus Bathyarchaeia archaeon]
MNFSEINDKTGFANGEPFKCEDNVRAYFRATTQRDMLGDDAITNQTLLDEMAETVIENGWHIVQ